MRWGISLPALVLLCSAAASGSSDARASTCPANLANQLADTGSATQLITVVSARARSTTGSLRLWRKSGECWVGVDGPWTAHLGRNGVSETKREGDKTTPAGAFGIQPVMYGVGANPGVRYRYHRIVPERGSGIFLHVSASGGATLGCISLTRAQLVTVLLWLDPPASPEIVIGTAATIRDY